MKIVKTLKFFFDGNPSDVMKGHVVKLLEYFEGDYDDRIRITHFENVSTGRKWSAKLRNVMTSKPKLQFDKPIMGKVIAIWNDENWQDTTNFEIEEGFLTEDHIFVKEGEIQKGQKAINKILTVELDTYVKICDPYISLDTIKMLKTISSNIDILVLTEKIHELSKVKKELNNFTNKIIIKKDKGLHDRFILTKGKGWVVGHSLKDFGTKDSYLTKMDLHTDAESNFDTKWIKSLSI